MKRKVIILVLACILLAFAFSVMCFASEAEGDYYMKSFDTSHDNNCCPNPSADGGEPCYKLGYDAGYADGCLETALSEEEKQAIINEYLASEAYAQAIAQAKAEALEDYKSSNEHTQALEGAKLAG
ncbi:MAG: hypothetical protein J6M16_06360 [Clostridia bacterium]|nr:hypothetical protein [Clostridia bacterium]